MWGSETSYIDRNSVQKTLFLSGSGSGQGKKRAGVSKWLHGSELSAELKPRHNTHFI